MQTMKGSHGLLLQGSTSRSLALSSLICLFLGPSSLAAPNAPQQCPAPTIEENGQCVLTRDETLNETIELSSNIVLDCKGHRLTPALQGKEPKGTNASVPSIPVAAVFLNDVTGAQVVRCVIDDFDFGVVVVNDGQAEALRSPQRAARRNSIHGNTLRTLYNGITIIKADNIEIGHNQIATKGFAPAIRSLLDSDFLHVHNNTIKAGQPGWREKNATNPPMAPIFPGSSDSSSFADGIAFDQMREDTASFSLGSTLILLTNDASGRATDNVIERNTIDLSLSESESSDASKGSAGVYVGALQDGLIIRSNTMTGGSHGVVLSPFLYDVNQPFPDASAWPRNVVVENNDMLGPFANAGVSARNTFNPTIRGNFITRADNAGVVLYGKSLETATVTRNLILGNKAGLRLRSSFTLKLLGPAATFFGARIFLNDITESSLSALETTFPEEPDYTFPSELSVEGRGNYWGRTCGQSQGFIEAGKGYSDSPDADVADSHPYGAPVAGTADAHLPLTCL